MIIDTSHAHLPTTVALNTLSKGDGFLTDTEHFAVVANPADPSTGLVPCIDMTDLVAITVPGATEVVQYDLDLVVNDHVVAAPAAPTAAPTA